MPLHLALSAAASASGWDVALSTADISTIFRVSIDLSARLVKIRHYPRTMRRWCCIQHLAELELLAPYGSRLQYRLQVPSPQCNEVRSRLLDSPENMRIKATCTR